MQISLTVDVGGALNDEEGPASEGRRVSFDESAQAPRADAPRPTQLEYSATAQGLRAADVEDEGGPARIHASAGLGGVSGNSSSPETQSMEWGTNIYAASGANSTSSSISRLGLTCARLQRGGHRPRLAQHARRDGVDVDLLAEREGIEAGHVLAADDDEALLVRVVPERHRAGGEGGAAHQFAFFADHRLAVVVGHAGAGHDALPLAVDPHRQGGRVAVEQQALRHTGRVSERQGDKGVEGGGRTTTSPSLSSFCCGWPSQVL